jgi:signal peptidase I
MLAVAIILVLGLAVAIGCSSVRGPVKERPPEPRFGLVGATGSMRPAFDTFDLVEVEQAPFADLKIGDVVVRRIGAYATVMHRIVHEGRAINGEKWFITKGDSVPQRDTGFLDAASYAGRIKLVRKADLISVQQEIK